MMQEVKMWPWNKKISFQTRLLIIPIIAFLFLLIPATEEILFGLLYPWEKIPSPPARPVELLGTGEGVGPSLYFRQTEAGQEYVIGDFFIMAEDGQVYGYEQMGKSWRASLAEQVQKRETCDHYGPWFSQKKGECVQSADWESPGVMHRFLLDSKRILWHWMEPAPISPSFLFCGLSGLAVGLLFFLIPLFIKSRQTTREQE
jgi:hypothetical protein